MNQRYNEIQRNNDSYDTNTNDVAVNESVAKGSVSTGSVSVYFSLLKKLKVTK